MYSSSKQAATTRQQQLITRALGGCVDSVLVLADALADGGLVLPGLVVDDVRCVPLLTALARGDDAGLARLQQHAAAAPTWSRETVRGLAAVSPHAPRLYAADCAERVLPVWDAWAECPAEHRDKPRAAIEVARRGDAARAARAARAAAEAAAAAAAWATRVAAWATRAAAEAAAEKRWQLERGLLYLLTDAPGASASAGLLTSQ